ncbi:MAG: hypothetical protein IAE88_15090 [Rhodobacteraceae bacterium]|nr:hypothetical protein [Paracoccaceae bacterium]
MTGIKDMATVAEVSQVAGDGRREDQKETIAIKEPPQQQVADKPRRPAEGGPGVQHGCA